MVMARRGTFSGSPPNMAAFWASVAGVKTFAQSPGAKRRQGLVEADVPVDAEAQELESIPPSLWIIAS